ncbi:MAG: TAXI family TRAP transporter solute-binding subunit [Pseudomonadota bacterium]
MMDRRTMMGLSAAAMASVTLPKGAAWAQVPGHWPRSMTMGTAALGGTFVIYGQGWATLISETLKVPVSTQVTQGPNQNLVLVHTKRVELGMTTMGPAFEAWTGVLELNKGVEHRDVRAMFPMYETPFQIVTMQKAGAANITSVRGLNGKVVGVGPAAGTPGTYFPRWFKELGLNVTIRNGGAADMASQLTDGRLDAFAFAAGLPISSFTELETQAKVNMFTFTPEEFAQLQPKNPFISPFTIQPGTYKTLTQPQQTVAMWNFAIAHKDLPADLVYAIVKTVHDNHRRMVQVHAAAEATLPQNIVHNKFMFFHPGAIRHYRELGLAIPKELEPPEFRG